MEPAAQRQQASRGAVPRVLQVSRVAYQGGAERVLLTLGQGLRQLGIQVTVACPPTGDVIRLARERGLATLACDFDPMRPTFGPTAAARYLRSWGRSQRQVTRYCLAAQVELIHVHHPVGALYCLPAARRLGIPLVLHVHDALPAHPLYALAMKAVAPFVARFVCVSAAAEDLLDSLHVRDDRVLVIANGVDWPFLDPPAPHPSVTGSGPHIGLFGVLEPRKGQDLFLRAAAQVVAVAPDARFWIVGGRGRADTGAYEAKLEALMAEPGLRGRVTMTGHQDDVAPWMRAMDVVVLASTAHESVGMVLIEAMTLGRPTVSTRIGVTEELIRDGVTGFLARTPDAAGLADAIVALLHADRASMGVRAARDMRARFSPATFSRNVRSVYTQLGLPA